MPTNPAALTAAQTRVLAAALDLFASHGVSGTSLQMIADALGVTKAAVYHQFHTKDEIVLALTAQQLAPLAETLAAAEAAPSRGRARDVLLTRVIDMYIANRHMVATLQNDPVIVRMLAEHAPFRQLIERLYRVLIGEDAGPEVLVPAAMFSAAISGAVIHPLVADLSDDVLRTHLTRLVRRLLGTPGRR